MTASAGAFIRRLPLGAEAQPDGGVHFRLWAPAAGSARVVFEGGRLWPSRRSEALRRAGPRARSRN
ncbi:MAG: hypothetical protein ACRD3V_05565 [Vicinamibacteria bacterium]